MGIKYLWDTNTVIYYLQQQFPLQSEKLIDELLKDSGPAISVITEIELLCWKTPFENDLKVLNNFIEEAFVIELDGISNLKPLRSERFIKSNSRMQLLYCRDSFGL